MPDRYAYTRHDEDVSGCLQGLEQSVRADGVRTAAQEAALAAQGCQLTQGDLYGEPLTAEQALAVAQNGTPRG